MALLPPGPCFPSDSKGRQPVRRDRPLVGRCSHSRPSLWMTAVRPEAVVTHRLVYGEGVGQGVQRTSSGRTAHVDIELRLPPRISTFMRLAKR